MVFGLNGSGKSTLARVLASELDFKYMDIEDYVFIESEIPYTQQLSREEYLYLMRKDIFENKNFVLSAVKGNFGDEIISLYSLGVFIDVPYEIRIERVKKRMLENFGDRVKSGGDMYESEMKFLEFVKSRLIEDVISWSESVDCPVIKVDGTKTIQENVRFIIEVFNELNQQ
jgi:adenylate kinase family enzyme